MKLNLLDMLYALSFALDTVQYEMGGISNQHGKHVAFISYLMGKELNYSHDKLEDLVGLAILHDNAFTEYVREEYNNGELLDYDTIIKEDINKLRTGFLTKQRHNVVGERNISLIPFNTNIENVILYHHENADGTGPLGKKDNETCEMAQIIHIADMMDVMFDINSINENDYKDALNKIKSLEGRLFSKEMVDILFKAVAYDKIRDLQKYGAITYLKNNFKTNVKDYNFDQIKGICQFFAQIIDYKSSITKNHSLGVASKCYKLAKYYEFDDEKCIRLYFAGAFHDIGKLIINNDILEKPGKLTTEEFESIKNHAKATQIILSKIEGIEDITRWASNHHEKLDGSGYNGALDKTKLTFEDRMLACVDIYQALIEKRSYKEKYNHEDAIMIMQQMASDNKIDINIVKDINRCFK